MPLPPAATSLSISTPDLSAGSGCLARAAPALCPEHRAPRVCQRPSCAALHVCRLYVDGFCPNGDAACRWGHEVSSEGNRAALAAHQLLALPERELLWMVRALLRQTAPVTAEEYRSQLAVCPQYAAGARCSRSDCFQLHLCPRLAAGRCGAEAACRWSHRLTDPDNVMVLLRLRCAQLSETEVLGRLARNSRHGGTSPGSEVLQTNGIGSDHVSVQHRLISLSKAQEPARTSTGTVVSSAIGVSKALPKATGSSSVPDQRMSALELDLCRHNIYPHSCPGDCGQLHLCRFFVAGMCPFGNKCMSGHKLLSSSHNACVLKERQLEGLSEKELFSAIKAGYLSRNQITDLERHFALKVCRPYQKGKHCGDNCHRLHVCSGYVAGTCTNGSGCGLSHQLTTGANIVIIRRVGLQHLKHKELLDVLNTHTAARDAWPSSSNFISPSASAYSSDAGPRLCATHVSGGRCQSDGCDAFHICGFFLAGVCSRLDSLCPLGHSFSDGHNQWVLEQHGLRGGSPEDFQCLIDQMTQRAHVTFPKEAEKDVWLCTRYNSKSSCNEQTCRLFHICSRYLAGTCHGKECPLLHTFDDCHNRTLRDSLGLAVASRPDGTSTPVTDRDLTELLRARLGVRPGVYEELPNWAKRTKTSSGRRITLPPVCSSLMTGRRCSDAGCVAIHVCPHFLAGACRRQRCSLGHRLDTESNRRALRLVGRHVTAQNHDSLVEELYTASENVQTSESYENLRICAYHNHQSGCDNQGRCSRVHICQKFVAGTCEGDHCSLGHVLCTRRNKKILRLLGLQNVEVDEVMEMLRAVHDLRSAYAK